MIDFGQAWADAWARLGLPASAATRERLLASYGERARHYHTQQHLAECLALFAGVAHLAQHPGAVAIALWFHDAVYIPQARDNEARSADWASAALRDAGADAALIARLQALIMATAHHDVGNDADMALLIDIDLAILGAAPARFDEYERQVREEYAAVPAPLYRHKRAALLARFLARPAIYTTPVLHARFEAQARANLGDRARP
jgi:predicted metal-dependent HD superfamily phosphohydrolase